jgi:hypothetical protein
MSKSYIRANPSWNKSDFLYQVLSGKTFGTHIPHGGNNAIKKLKPSNGRMQPRPRNAERPKPGEIGPLYAAIAGPASPRTTGLALHADGCAFLMTNPGPGNFKSRLTFLKPFNNTQRGPGREQI